MISTKYKILILFVIIVLFLVVCITFFFTNNTYSKSTPTPSPLITNAPLGIDQQKLKDIPLVKNAVQQLPTIENKIKNNPKDIDLLKQAAQVYNMKGDLDNAILYYKQAIELDKNDYQLFNEIGDVYVEKNDIQSAIEAYSRSIELKSISNSAYINLANLYELKSRDFASAIIVYEKAIAADQNNVDLLSLLASLYTKDKQSTQAATLYQTILKIDPTNQTALNSIKK